MRSSFIVAKVGKCIFLKQSRQLLLLLEVFADLLAFMYIANIFQINIWGGFIYNKVVTVCRKIKAKIKKIVENEFWKNTMRIGDFVSINK